MWTALAHNIIKYRLPLFILIGLITIFMGYHARNVEMSYDFKGTVPDTDEEAIIYKQFRDSFGEDGNVVALGVEDSSIYKYQNFIEFRALSQRIQAVNGVKGVISIPDLQIIFRDTVERQFVLRKVFPDSIGNQQVLDSLLTLTSRQMFYKGQLWNPVNGATLMLVTIDKEVLNSSERINLTNTLIELGDSFNQQTGIKIRYAGLPFVRSVIAGQVSKELQLFLLLSVLVTGIIMLLFFRSLRAVIFPLIIIAVVVIWVLGTIELLGFKITLLSGLIPPVIVVIGIPNSIYLINKFHQEFARHGNKMKAISVVIRKVGIATLITNVTTAIGFLVLLSTDIVILREFGIVAGINVMATFLVSIILLPGVFSWMPAPSVKHLKHLKIGSLSKFLSFLDLMVHRRRPVIYITTAFFVVFSLVGMSKIHTVSFMVDDIPEDSNIQKDLDWLEANFSGIMPLEIVVDLGKRFTAGTDLGKLQRIDRFEKFLEEQQDISKPISLVSFIKALRQAYYYGSPNQFVLPAGPDLQRFASYLQGNEQSENPLLNSFIDSTRQKLRISMQVADIGSDKMDSLVNQVILPQVDSIFSAPIRGDTLKVIVTGTTPLFIKGNKFLVRNLKYSLALAFMLIAVTMGLLFANFRMIVISLIPNIIPMMITAALMGYFGIPLKPSTVLIFSITFGISVDYSIHFLAKYRQELHARKFFVPIAVSNSILEVGKSMVYTSIILFAGFVIFAGSSFGGTIALGTLTSTTLVIAMLTNLTLLPALIMTFDRGKYNENEHLLIEQFEGFYTEDEDEEIDMKQLKINEDKGKSDTESSI
jgi:uncharacterized protein